MFREIILPGSLSRFYIDYCESCNVAWQRWTKVLKNWWKIVDTLNCSCNCKAKFWNVKLLPYQLLARFLSKMFGKLFPEVIIVQLVEKKGFCCWELQKFKHFQGWWNFFCFWRMGDLSFPFYLDFLKNISIHFFFSSF